MKCYECESLKTDKLKEPCCSCVERPHDLCCDDNFKQAERKPEVHKMPKVIPPNGWRIKKIPSHCEITKTDDGYFLSHATIELEMKIPEPGFSE